MGSKDYDNFNKSYSSGNYHGYDGKNSESSFFKTILTVAIIFILVPPLMYFVYISCFQGEKSFDDFFAKYILGKNIDEEKLQSLMLEDLVNRTDKFFNQDKESVMICDRYLFSNYIHSFNMTSVSEFLNTLSGYWAQKNLPMYDIFVKNCLTTIVVSIPEDVRLKRMFFNRSESERDSNENEIYQQKLYDRYYNIMSHDRYQLDKAFNIQLYYPKINDSIL